MICPEVLRKQVFCMYKFEIYLLHNLIFCHLSSFCDLVGARAAKKSIGRKPLRGGSLQACVWAVKTGKSQKVNHAFNN
jgi:hypothetical protein